MTEATCRLCRLLAVEQLLQTALIKCDDRIYRRRTLLPALRSIRNDRSTTERFAAECGGSPEQMDHFAWTH